MAIVRVTTTTSTQRAVTMAQSVAIRPVTMRQIYNGQTFTFRFPFAPREVNFDDLNADVMEIENPMRYPNLSQKGLRPTRLSFTVTIAERQSSGLKSVDDELRQLRAMALRDAPVTFTGMDRLLQYQAQLPGETTLSQSQWRITSLAVKVKYRANTPASVDAVANQIAQADVSLGFTEQRNVAVSAVYLPKLVYPVEFPSGGGGGGDVGSVGTSGGAGDGYGDY